MKYKTYNQGLIKTILIIVVALLILSYFGLNLRNIVNSPTGKDNFGYVKSLVVNTWNGYLKKPADYVWNKVFLPLIWQPAIENLTKIKNGEPDSIRSNAPTLPPIRQIQN
jgi:hypothetical protein